MASEPLKALTQGAFFRLTSSPLRPRLFSCTLCDRKHRPHRFVAQFALGSEVYVGARKADATGQSHAAVPPAGPPRVSCCSVK